MQHTTNYLSYLIMKQIILSIVFLSMSITVYPNPTNGLVHIEIPNQNMQNIKVYDLQGQLIKETNQSPFNLSNYSNGPYFIKAQTNQGIYTYKLIKK